MRIRPESGLYQTCQVFAGDAGEVRRVVRGGSWNNNERNVRAAYRNHNEPSNANNNLGFRCARSISPGGSPGLNAVRPRAADRAQETERRLFLAAGPEWPRANREEPCPLW